MCDGEKEQAKCRTSFLLGYTVYSDFVVDTDAPQERTLDGGAAKPLCIKVSWGGSSEEGGAVLTSKFLGLCFVLGARQKVYDWLLSRFLLWGNVPASLSP